MVNIGFTGDFCPWLRIETLYKNTSWESSFHSITPFFEKNHLNVADLECPLVEHGCPIKKTGPHMKALPGTVEILNYLNIKLVATANNHFKDYGKEGIEHTYKTLNEAGIRWIGSGLSFDEASKPTIIQRENLLFAFINATENEWATTYDNEAGCNPLEPVNIYNQIQSVRGRVDFVIVIIHGGHEHYNLPSPRMKKWYRFFIDAGADAVVGHHTHTISGYEIYKEKPIFYSLGNFCIDWEGFSDKPWNIGMLLRLIFNVDRSIGFELKFIRQNDRTPGVILLGSREEARLLQDIKVLNEIINDDEKLNGRFDEFVSLLKPVMNTSIQPYRGWFFPRLHKRGLLPDLIGERKKRMLTNLIRCEAHRDVLLRSLLSGKK